MTENIEIESGKSPLLRDVIDRLDKAGVDWHEAELRMGYIRKSSPILGDIRAAAVIAVDPEGHASEVVHMPLEYLDPLTLDRDLVLEVLDRYLDSRDSLEHVTNDELAHAIIAALRAGTTKEN